MMVEVIHSDTIIISFIYCKQIVVAFHSFKRTKIPDGHVHNCITLKNKSYLSSKTFSISALPFLSVNKINHVYFIIKVLVEDGVTVR